MTTNPDSPQENEREATPVALVEELRIEASIVPNRRGQLYALAADRIAELERAMKAADSLMRKAHEDHCACEQARAASQAELAAVREDALRYRWLREHTTYRDIGYTSDPSGRTGMLCTPLQRRWYHDSRLLTCDTLDAAIDAERARKER